MRASLSFLIAVSLLGQGCTTCHNSVLAEIPSPSATWKAGLIARSCGSVHGLVVNVVAQEETLVPKGTAERTALSLPLPCCLFPGADESRQLVSAQWLTTTELRVSYPRSLRPLIARTEVDGVQIDLVPVDTWLETRKPKGE
jgi:hypothetical protein